MGAMATYVRAGLPEVATALAALTGEPHPLAIKDPAARRRLAADQDADADLSFGPTGMGSNPGRRRH